MEWLFCFSHLSNSPIFQKNCRLLLSKFKTCISIGNFPHQFGKNTFSPCRKIKVRLLHHVRGVQEWQPPSMWLEMPRTPTLRWLLNHNLSAVIQLLISAPVSTWTYLENLAHWARWNFPKSCISCSFLTHFSAPFFSLLCFTGCGAAARNSSEDCPSSIERCLSYWDISSVSQV